MKNSFKIAAVGATGAVGSQLLAILAAREFPVSELIPFASARSEGKVVQWKGKAQRIKKLQQGCFEGIDLAFFDASDAVSREWVMHAAEAGAWVVDHSSVYRLEEDVPLLVPEVNGNLLRARFASRPDRKFSPRERLLSGPNCSAAPLSLVLKPIRDQWGLKRVVVSTYQSTSGAGASAMDELSTQTVGMFNQKPSTPRAFPHQIAFNCIPSIGGARDSGDTGEEEKIIVETRKILGMPQLKVTATAVRVPTFSCHGESVNIECERPVTVEEVRAALQAQAGIILQDDLRRNIYPMNLTSPGDFVEGATGKDSVYVGRIRKDESVESGINLWLVSDNLRKGAALNAVQVGELLVELLRD